MARRTLKRRRVSRRRKSNPRRSTGMLVINPRRRKRAASKKRKSNPRKRRVSAARRRPARRRAAPRRRRVAGAKRRAYGLRRRPARRTRTKVVYRTRANPKKKRKTRRRRKNPGMLGGLKRIPLVGPLLSGMASFLPQAVFGAVSVEPTMWLAKMLGGFMPALPASLGYTLYGLLLGGAITAFGGMIGLKPPMRKQLATAAAAAAGGVAYYKWRMGADVSMAEEVGLLELHGVGGLGSLLVDPGSMSGVYGDMAYNVMPYPGVA